MIMRNLFTFLATSLLLSSAAGAFPQYRVTDLAVPVETFPYAIDMNDYGQIAGSTHGGAPFVWTPASPGATTGSYTPLETPPGFSHFATGINERGQIVGSTFTGPANVALLWQPDSPNGAPGAPTPSAPFGGFAYGINDSGQIAGSSIVNQLGAGFLFKPTTPNGSTGSAVNVLLSGKMWGLNDRGQTVGVNSQGVVIWHPSSPNAMTGSLIPIGTTGDTSISMSINSTGQVAGRNAESSPFLWTPTIANGTSGVLTLIPRFAGLEHAEVLDMNDAGVVLGTSYGGDPFGFRPWLWSSAEGLVDINQLLLPQDVAAGWIIERGGAINNNGSIVALATLNPPGAPALSKTVLLTPVPESNAAVLIVAAATGLLMRRNT